MAARLAGVRNIANGDVIQSTPTMETMRGGPTVTKVSRTYRLEQAIIDRLDAIARRDGVTATAALERAILAYADGTRAQDELRHEADMLRATVESLRKQLESSRDYAATMAELFKIEQENVAAITSMVQSTQMVAGVSLTRTAPTAPTGAMEIVPQAQAQRMTFRQWLAQRLAR